MPSKIEKTYNEVKVFKSLMLYTLMYIAKSCEAFFRVGERYSEYGIESRYFYTLKKIVPRQLFLSLGKFLLHLTPAERQL